MAVTLSAIAAAFATGSLVNGTLQLSHPAGLVALVSANLYVIFFNLSWGPVMWILLGEMFPNQIRGSGLAVAGFAQWIANYGITVSFPMMAASLGLVVTYGFYALSALVSFFFVRAMVHETKGVELEHMRG
jgi:SP family sugar:H+ symporter-like MFS transporter